MICRIENTLQIRGNPTGAIPSQVEATAPTGVETRRSESIICGVCNSPKQPTDFYVKDRGTHVQRDPLCKRCRIEKQRTRILGVTPQQYDEMHKNQQGLCGICQHRLRSRRYKAFCVDHCHETGRVRGLLCHNCNRAIGMLQDSVENLLRAIKWIKG